MTFHQGRSTDKDLQTSARSSVIWWMQDDSLCISYTGDTTTTCYTMQLNGDQLTLPDPEGTVLFQRDPTQRS